MTRFSTVNKTIVVVGCGGVASWLLPCLTRLMEGAEAKPRIILADGDKLEPKNLDRQLFDESDIGKFKSDALAARYAKGYKGKLVSHPEFISDSWDAPAHSLYLGCADNHAARKTILALVDQHGGKAIIGGNEYTDAEAYYYEPAFKGTNQDPRLYYPTIMSDHTGDPTAPQSCQGEAAVASPQLVLANFAAAHHMAHLLWYHCVERPSYTPEVQEEIRSFWPIHHRSNNKCLDTLRVRDKEPLNQSIIYGETP